MENRAVQTARRLLHGYSHRDGVEMLDGIKDAAAIVEDILAKGPRQPGAQKATEPDAPAGGKATSAFDAFAASVDAANLQPARKTPSAFDAFAASVDATQPEGAQKPPPPEPKKPGSERPDYPVPDFD